MLAYEPIRESLPAKDEVVLLGLESVRETGAWPTFRHVFDLGEYDAGLHVELDTLGHISAFAVGYTSAGEEILTVL